MKTFGRSAIVGGRGNPSEFPGDPQRPVENVSWDDTQEFCRRLSAQDRQTYRLPTEAEWEYACRAGRSGRWCFGDDQSMLKQYAWYCDNANGTTHPVGTRKPNAWGLYDMHGNVWEWYSDWWRDYASAEVSDPTGPAAGSDRVGRGGGWSSDAGGCRSAYRDGDVPDGRSFILGFRLAFSSVDASGG